MTIMTTIFSESHGNQPLSPGEDWIDDDILATIDQELEEDPDFQRWLGSDDGIDGDAAPTPPVNDSVWVPFSRADRAWADRLGAAYPDRELGEVIRQKTLAAQALTRYLESHGVAVDRSAANHRQPLLQWLNPKADVVLPDLGRLEAVLVDRLTNAVEIDLDPGTLGYGIVAMGEGGAELWGVLLSHDLRQDWPEGGMVPVKLAKPMGALWTAHQRWQKCRQLMAAYREQQGWSMELHAEVITELNRVYAHEEDFERPFVMDRFLTERVADSGAVMGSNLHLVREETADAAAIQDPGAEAVMGSNLHLVREETADAAAIQDPGAEAVNWLGVVMAWFVELEQWEQD